MLVVNKKFKVEKVVMPYSMKAKELDYESELASRFWFNHPNFKAFFNTETKILHLVKKDVLILDNEINVKSLKIKS